MAIDGTYTDFLKTIKDFIFAGKLKFNGFMTDHLFIDDLDTILFQIYGVECDEGNAELSISRFEQLCKRERLLEWINSPNAFSILKAKLAQSGVVWDADHEPDFSGLTQAAS